MEPAQPLPPLPHLPLKRDLAAILLFTVIVVALAAHYEWNEALFAMTRRWERIQLDEWPIAAFALSLGLAWLSWRRYAQAREQLQARWRTEALLGAALAENRRLAHDHLRMQERDCKHLARELHDELGQYTNAIKLDAVALRDSSESGEARAAEERILSAVDHMHAVVSDIIRRLRPAGLDELGLLAALENCVDHWRARVPGTRFALHADGEFEDLGELMKLTLYRLVQEALTNCSRHSDGRNIDILLRRDRAPASPAREILAAVADDGDGVTPGDFRAGFGLRGMRERIELMGGTLQIDTAPGKGFRIEAHLPASGHE